MKIFEQIRYMVKNISTVLIENDIKCWIDFGTLLGFSREGDIISWDTDADFSFFKGERDQLILTLVNTIVPKYQYQLHVTTTGRLRLFPEWGRTNIWVDFYMFKDDGSPSEVGFGKGFKIDSKTKVTTLKTKCNFSVPIPTNYIQRLIDLYGDTYMTPTKRIPYWR